jgi:hypothetical protein
MLSHQRHAHAHRLFRERLQHDILITVHGLLHGTSATRRRAPRIAHLLDIDAPDPALEGAVSPEVRVRALATARARDLGVARALRRPVRQMQATLGLRRARDARRRARLADFRVYEQRLVDYARISASRAGMEREDDALSSFCVVSARTAARTAASSTACAAPCET